MQRYFALNKDLSLSNEDIHHISSVMRMKKDDMIEVVYQKKIFLCKINSLNEHDINVSIIDEIMKIDDINSIESSLKIVCSINKLALNLKEVLSKHKKCDKILVVIDPEGGLTLEEEKLVNSDFIRVSLGNRILRAETVPISLLSILNYEYMR